MSFLKFQKLASACPSDGPRLAQFSDLFDLDSSGRPENSRLEFGCFLLNLPKALKARQNLAPPTKIRSPKSLRKQIQFSSDENADQLVSKAKFKQKLFFKILREDTFTFEREILSERGSWKLHDGTHQLDLIIGHEIAPSERFVRKDSIIRRCSRPFGHSGESNQNHSELSRQHRIGDRGLSHKIRGGETFLESEAFLLVIGPQQSRNKASLLHDKIY